MIATILSPASAAALRPLQKIWELQSIASRLAEDFPVNAFSHLVVEYGLIGNKIIKRLRATAKYGVILILQEQCTENYDCDLLELELSEENIIFGSEKELEAQVKNILLRDLPQTKNENLKEAASDEDDDNTAEPKPPISIIPRVASDPSIRSTESSMSVKFESGLREILIAVVGAGGRIGTTTQALQILLFLRKRGYSVCLVEMQCKNSLKKYKACCGRGAYEEDENDPNHIKLLGIDIYTDPLSALKARFEYDAVVLDYGRFDEMLDYTELYGKDVTVVVCGGKPAEVEFLEQKGGVFSADNGNFNYIVTHIAPADRKDVKKAMLYPSQTFFAPVTQNQFVYCGDDALYNSLMIPRPIGQRKRKRRGRGIRA